MIFHVSHGCGERSRTSFFNTIIKTTNKCGNKLQGQRGSLVFVLKLICTFIGQNPKFFYACGEEGCSASLPIAREKQT
jgi:hypothetical protein